MFIDVEFDDVGLYVGDRLEFLSHVVENSVQLVVTSPPYNLGKSYETRKGIHEYLEEQQQTLAECYRVLSNCGSLCWQTGNYIVGDSEILPLDIPVYGICNKLGMKLRNRIVWHFGHGLHCRKRFSGRYETILWFTKSDQYVFNLDPVRVPQQYPMKKHFKGSRKGQLSCNPLGKNPSDVWLIPNVKHNHCEKTEHPCQFPVELVERLVLSLTDPGDLVLDPYMGVASSLCAALKHGRRVIGADINRRYVDISYERIIATKQNNLKTRPMRRYNSE